MIYYFSDTCYQWNNDAISNNGTNFVVAMQI